MNLDQCWSKSSSAIQEEWARYLSESTWHPQLKALALPRVGQGKCLRPLLIFSAYQSLQNEVNFIDSRLLKVALALEMLHTYSLVHDDLPCMDNDDTRRGLPTAHREASEATALLLGDALLTGAFELLATSSWEASVVQKLIIDLARFSGGAGMISGQQRDLHGTISTLEDLKTLHEEKTGALFAFCIKTAARLALAPDTFQKAARSYENFGLKMGLLFQVVDDILDAGEEGPSFVSVMGLDATRKYAKDLRDELMQEAEVLNLSKLQPMIELFYNRKS